MSARSSTASGASVPAGMEGGEVLGGHVGQRAADHRAVRPRRRAIRPALGGEVEVQQHRRAVGGQQDVRGLQVAVEQPARMGVVEPFGQPGDDPDRGLDGRGLPEELACRLMRVVVEGSGGRRR